jgi:predicted XRE-type DNA-binding protein
MENRIFKDVFDAQEDDPVKHENMKLISQLMHENKIKTDKEYHIVIQEI